MARMEIEKANLLILRGRLTRKATASRKSVSPVKEPLLLKIVNNTFFQYTNYGEWADTEQCTKTVKEKKMKPKINEISHLKPGNFRLKKRAQAGNNGLDHGNCHRVAPQERTEDLGRVNFLHIVFQRARQPYQRGIDIAAATEVHCTKVARAQAPRARILPELCCGLHHGWMEEWMSR